MYMSPEQTIGARKRNEKPYAAAIIVTSDTCCDDETKDESGAFVQEQLKLDGELFHSVTKRCVKDDKQAIVECLEKCLCEEDAALVITIGGTGLTPRDVTPDAVSPLYERTCNGIVAALHMASLRYTPHAALSRLTAGIIGECLIINFPGSLKACRDCLPNVILILEHALEQVRFNAKAYNDTHLRFKALSNGINAVPPCPPLLPPSNNVAGPALSVVGNEAGDKVASSFLEPKKPPVQTKRKYFTPRKSISPGSEPSHSKLTSLLQRTSRLSIQEVQASRAELHNLNQPHKHQHKHAKPPGLNKNPYKRFTSLDNLGHKHAQKPYISPALPKLPATKVPETQSSYEMIDFSKAHEILGSLSGRLLLESEEVTLSSFEAAFKLIGRVLTNDLRSRQAMPPYTVSTMDGYVLNIPPPFRKLDVIKPVVPAKLLQDLVEFRAWQVHAQNSQTFFCYRVNTGGKLPPKNFAVVPVEDTGPVTAENSVPITVARQNVFQRKPGSDLATSDTLARGTVIGAIEMSLILAMGHKQLSVFKQPRIGILSTGDEIVNFFSTPEVGSEQVVDTNGPLLSSMFRSRGYFCSNYGIAKDEPNLIYASMAEALKKCDVLVVTGGASMGTKDYVKDVIKHMGGTIHFGRVNIKPGKPVAFASLVVESKTKFIFSLPGNPVSAYITSLLLVLPFIEHGTKHHFQPLDTMSLDCVGEFIQVTVAKITGEPYEFDGRLEFVRAKIITRQPSYQVEVSMQQQSSRILSLKDCDCLIMIPPSSKGQKFVLAKSYPALRITRPL